MKELSTAGKRVIEGLIRYNVGIKPEENVLVLADEETDPAIRDEVVAAAKSAGGIVTLALIDKLEKPNIIRSPVIVKALEGADVYICLLTLEIVKPEAVKGNMLNNGLRFICMSGLTAELLTSPPIAEVDYAQMAQLSERVHNLLAKTDLVEITCPAGTNFRFSIKGRKGGGITNGVAREIGTQAWIPAGDVYAGANHGSANGVVVLHYFQTMGKFKKPLRLKIEKSWIVGVEGGEELEREKFESIIYGHENGNYVAEALGFGLNDKAFFTGQPDLLMEKMMLGVLHIGIGDSTAYGLDIKCDFHMDGAIVNPTLKLDGKIIMDKGKLKI